MRQHIPDMDRFHGQYQDIRFLCNLCGAFAASHTVFGRDRGAGNRIAGADQYLAGRYPVRYQPPYHCLCHFTCADESYPHPLEHRL
ncbi:hypothetical protein SDC9_172769 [bioreactor metagenome]|uniref:Uncharacterized protein n=1 Tax=bioreactor metagenome TaxID=1076179 RepID=A0A645GGT5_9ZZZZ